ncbi:hypothetical protein BKA83DRAFT_4497542 [Pisolithus microcarpus]|nr:hypothetical protein BKA83DRAFT_4497542 [Pisolithus microcarpus]
MKFVKNSKELGATVNRILSIYERLVISSGTLESAVKLKRWREAMKEMREVLESVRAIADRTDNVPPMLIGVDKFIRWTDDIGTPGVPFPDWNSWMVRLESPTANPVLVRVPMTPEPENRPVSNVAPSHPVSVDKGKGKALPAESQAIERERTTQGDVNEDGESEVVEPDIQMDEETSEPVRGRSKKRARSQSESRPSSTRRKSQSRTKQSSRRDGEPKGEGMSAPSDPPTMPKPKYGRAQVAARTTPPPDPHACRTCINRKVVCTWTVGNIPCDPCKKRKIGCGKGNVRHASTARTPKTPAKCQATPTPRNSPRPRTPVPPQADDDTVPPPRKKARISKRAQIPLSEVEGSSSSAPQRRVTLVVCPPREAPQKHAVPPAIRAEPSTNTPLPAPPIPPSHAHSPPLEPMPLRLSPVDPSNISYHRRLDDIIKRQDLIFGRVDEVDRWVADVAGRILVQYQDRMQALEGELADCRLTVGTLTREIETLRASVHGAHPAQNTAPPPVEADLFDLFGPSTNNTTTVEAEESIAAQLQGLVFTATPSGQEMATSGRQDPSLAAPVEVDSSSMQVGSGSGAASTGNEEQGGTVVFTDKH